MMLFIFFHITSWHRATRSLTYDNFIVIQPNSHTHTLSAFLSHTATAWHRAKVLDTPHSRNSIYFFFNATTWHPSPHSIGPQPIFSSFRHHVAERKSPRHTALSVLDRILFFSRHLVTQSKSPQHTALPVLDRIFAFSTPPRGTEQKSLTHCSIGPRPNFLSFPRHFVAQSKSL